MDFFQYSERLDYIYNLIEKEQLASPVQLASKFECSERTVRKMINDLRRKGHSIKYSRSCSKYYLAEK
ncbi:HTH domain-containing protein [Marinoscillum sp.]|uniref:HTH domain-containing protein n=1 Tax=Marinoscillum sp. TaxID=2024838 RepID=UPI003BA84464